MNQKRSWPGVPNRYRIRLVSSRPTLAVVMAASVVSGMISETAPTKVVLPTPKPPAMTILTGVGARDSPAGAVGLYCPESIEHPLEKCEVWAVADAGGPMHGHQSFFGHVTDQDTGDAEREVQARGDLGDGQDVPAQQGDRPPFQAQGHRRLAECGRGDERLQLEVVVSGARPPACHGVGP